MLSKSRSSWLRLSIIALVGLLGLAVYLESAIYLYAASAFPLVIALLMPDWAKHQYVKARKNNHVRFVRLTVGSDPMLAISFVPGYIRWNRGSRKLYFRWNAMNESPEHDVSPNPGAHETSITVLPYDLSAHPRKQGWIGIDLSQLAERTGPMSYSINEVTRLLIRVSDLEAVAMPKSASSGSTLSPAAGKQLQA